MKKKFSDTGVGQFLKDKLPGVVSLVGDYFPPAKILSQLIGPAKQQLTPEDQAKLDSLMYDYEKEYITQMSALAQSEEANTTDRWKSDMTSDSWLSKNVRPITLLYFLAANTLLILLSAYGIKFDAGIVTLIQTPEIIVIAAYFGGRSLEKITKMKNP